MHFRKSGFMYNACGTFTKNKTRIQKLMATGDFRYVYRKELYKACFQLAIISGCFKDQPKRTESEKVFHDKALKIASDPKHNGYQRGLASMVYKIFDKKPKVISTHTGTGNYSEDQQLANELHKPINISKAQGIYILLR